MEQQATAKLDARGIVVEGSIMNHSTEETIDKESIRQFNGPQATGIDVTGLAGGIDRDA